MFALIMLAAVSFALCLLFTPVCRHLAISAGFVDLPDNNRKIHKKPIPRVGGIALALGYFGSCITALILAARYSVPENLNLKFAIAIAPAVLVVFAIGLADDIFGLQPWHKLLGEIVAASMIVAAGIDIRPISIALHPAAGAVCSVIWLVACANAVNLIDGVDGLAAGIGLVGTSTVIAASLFVGHYELAAAAAPLAGALLAFLVFNFHPASIFLGDSGSLVIGFLLGCYGLLWSASASTPVSAAAPLMALAIPLSDTSVAIFRRYLRRKPIFSPDRSHVHHRLLARGFSGRRVTLLLYVAAIIAGVLSLSLIQARGNWEAAVIVLIFAAAAIYGIQQLGYPEFNAARRLLSSDRFRRELNAQIAVEEFDKALTAAATPYECWTVIHGAAREFGVHQIQMKLAGEDFAAQHGPCPAESWIIRIPLSGNDWVELVRGVEQTGHSSAFIFFADTIRAVLGGKQPLIKRSRERPVALSVAIG